MSGRRFVGREAELIKLEVHLEQVRQSGSGRILAVRGRRQIGKSRLVEEFIRRSAARAIFYTASRQSAPEELRSFSEHIAASATDAATVAAAGPIGSWEAALTIAVSDASAQHPIVVVIDELPFLIESEPAIEAIIQKQWDRRLEGQPVLLLLIGSDISMMTALNDYGRPLYGRLTEMTIGPLSPAAIGDMLGLSATATLDAYLTIGGFPRLAEIWRRGEDVWKFLRQTMLPDPRFGKAEFVGAFWNRSSSVEVDLVGGRGQATSEKIDFVGSIKWRDRAPLDRSDLSKLIQHRALIPGATDETLLIGVSRSDFAVEGLDVRLTPEDIIAAFSA